MNENNNQDLPKWDRLHDGQATDELRELWNLSGKFGQSYTPDVEGGLERLHAKLAAEPNIAKRRFLWHRRAWLRLAAAIIGLGLIGGWWYQQALPATEWTVVLTGAGEQRELILPDGSELILNENTRLSYANDLATATERHLRLQGEAYFDVKRAPEQPFRIQTASVEVTVLGTAFNLRAPAAGELAELAVTHGRVAFQAPSAKAALIVEKGDLAHWEKGQVALVRTAQTTDNYWAWHSRSLEFKDAPLSEVLELLARTYQIQFEQPQAISTGDCRLTGRWEQLAAPEALRLLETLTGLKVEEAASPSKYRLGGQCEG